MIGLYAATNRCVVHLGLCVSGSVCVYFYGKGGWGRGSPACIRLSLYREELSYVLDHMRAEGCAPTAATYDYVLTTLIAKGPMSYVKDILEDLWAHQLLPLAHTASALVAMYLSQNEGTEAALALFDRLGERKAGGEVRTGEVQAEEEGLKRIFHFQKKIRSAS